MVAVADAVNAPKAVLSALANAVLSEVKVALSHVAKAVLNALPPKAVLKAVAVRNGLAKLAQTCAPKAARRASPAAKVNPAAKAVVTAAAVIVQNAQSARTVASVVQNAPAHLAMQLRKNWHSLIRPPWQPLHAVM
jgi:hypothetical protein